VDKKAAWSEYRQAVSKAELRCTSCLHAKAMELFEGLVPCSIDSDVFAVRELQSSRLRFPEDYPVLVGCAAKLFAAGEKVAEDFNARGAILLYECDMTADPSGRSLLPDPFGVGMAMEMASALRAFASSAEHVLAKVRQAMLSGGPGADSLALDGQTKLHVTLEPEDTHRGFNVAKLNLNEFSLLKQLETLQHVCGQGKKFAEENRVVLIQASLCLFVLSDVFGLTLVLCRLWSTPSIPASRPATSWTLSRTRRLARMRRSTFSTRSGPAWWRPCGDLMRRMA
jgi:hypothetical protein